MFKYKNKKEQSDRRENNQLRQEFRLQIRRRNVEQYKQNIRNIYLTEQISKQNHQNQQILQEPVLQSYLQNEGEQLTENQNQILYELEQLSLTHPSCLCQVEMVTRIQEILSHSENQNICQKVDCIVIKMCVNQYYWSDQFLSRLLNLLEILSKKGINIYQYLIHLGETQIIQKKLRAYTFIVSKKLLPSLIRSKSGQIKPNKKYQTYEVIEVLKSFLARVPIVSHKQRYLDSISPYHCLSHILQLLSKLLAKNKGVQSKQAYEIIQIVYILVSKLEQQQIRTALSVLRDQKWSLLMQLIKDINDKKMRKRIDFQFQNINQSEKKLDHSLEIRMKFKICQITSIIIQFLLFQQNSSRTVLQLVYSLLPQLCIFVVSDVQFFFGESRPRVLSAIQLKYESVLLKQIVILLSVKDQVEQTPAFQYISIKYPCFFKDLYTGFLQTNLQNQAVRRNLVEIVDLLSEETSNICCQSWVVQFIIHFLDSQNYHWSITFKNVVSVCLFILSKHNHQKDSCLLENSLKENRIRRKIQQMIYNLIDDGELKNKLEGLLNLIQSNIKD